MPEQADILEGEINPIDSVEEVLHANNWTFNRTHNDELVVEVAGKSCGYRLFFVWQEDMNALQFGCHYDLNFAPRDKERAYNALPEINENLWLGHFDLPKDTAAPIFRYTCLLRNNGNLNITETIEDMVEIALTQCEHYYPAFYLLANAANDLNTENISLALMQTVGES